MTSGLEAGARIFLDACCLINLLASGRIEEILADLPYRFAVSRYVAEREVLHIYGEATSEPRRPDLQRLAAAGCMEIRDLREARELAELVRFASELDDGEASICALAAVHGGGVATDDRKARRILGQWTPEVVVVQTPEILFEWSRERRLGERQIRDLLILIRTRASFVPRRDAPHFLWWKDHLK